MRAPVHTQSIHPFAVHAKRPPAFVRAEPIKTCSNGRAPPPMARLQTDYNTHTNHRFKRLPVISLSRLLEYLISLLLCSGLRRLLRPSRLLSTQTRGSALRQHGRESADRNPWGPPEETRNTRSSHITNSDSLLIYLPTWVVVVLSQSGRLSASQFGACLLGRAFCSDPIPLYPASCYGCDVSVGDRSLLLALAALYIYSHPVGDATHLML
ncbi:hypothetical protein F5Y07DRAFT_172694 [Xylaria sp. FL0933]|nr:hypothetical protein F5Y07DRAFT_172694 [Xylaria sp. FL0933]